MVTEIKWPLAVQIQLAKAYDFILKDSYQNAEKVKNDILTSTRQLIHYPEMHPLDKYRKNNDGSFRSYEIYHYRISYRVLENEIIIVRIRHTKMLPRLY